MSNSDPVFARLAELPMTPATPELSARLRASAHARLRPRRVGREWALLVALSVISYLGWAVQFAGSLY